MSHPPPPSRSLIRSGATCALPSPSSRLPRPTATANVGNQKSRSRSSSSVVVAVFKKKRQETTTKNNKNKNVNVSYGRDWYEATRDPSRGLTPREEMERRRRANWEANNGKERKDLYTDNWAGSEYRGSGLNVLTVLLVVSVAVPALGLLFAFKTYGVLWG